MSARASGPRRTGLTARKAFGVGRIVLAAAGIVGLVGNFGYTLGFATFVTSNFFSYFTTQSAIAMVVMFVLAAVIAFRRAQDPSWLDTFRALVTTYIIVSGIVYAIIVVQASTRGPRPSASMRVPADWPWRPPEEDCTRRSPP